MNEEREHFQIGPVDLWVTDEGEGTYTAWCREGASVGRFFLHARTIEEAEKFAEKRVAAAMGTGDPGPHRTRDGRSMVASVADEEGRLMNYTTDKTTQAFSRATKTLLSLDLSREQADVVINILRDVVSVVVLDVTEQVSATLVEQTRKALERKAREQHGA